ncbi:hypothetical protein D3C85_159210 [compost metagenome]
MRFYIDHPIDDNDPSKKLELILLGDVKKSAEIISRQFPAENLTVWGIGVARYVFNGGELVRDVPNLNTYYTFDSDDVEGPRLMREWTEVIANTDPYNPDEF